MPTAVAFTSSSINRQSSAMCSFLPLVFFSLLLVASNSRVKAEGGEDDLVANIPAINFQPNYKTYSGYLYANQQKTWKMHYMLTTSRSNKTTDPVVFWFNGGPGCSSFTGSFQELGPMYVDANGSAIFENVYSWNSIANVVYLESPIGVGFSYDTTNVNYKQASDDQTAEQNYAAIADFFVRAQTQFKDRDFFLAGESYAGIYIPTLAAQIAANLQAFPNQNFRGVLIGNGFMHVRTLMNSLVQWSYYHGQIGYDDWTALKNKTCCQLPSGSTDTDQCDWTPYLTTKNGLDYVVGDKTTECGKALARTMDIQQDPAVDQYNFYQECYADRSNSSAYPLVPQAARVQKNPAAFFNRQSTDALEGYACVSGQNALAYFNRSDFAAAFHIDDAFFKAGGFFDDCSDTMYNTYQAQYNDTTQFFDTIFDKLSNFRILILNGDVDTVCNFLGDAQFAKLIADKRGLTSTPRQTWYFRKRVGGYVQRYADQKNSTLDVLTLKGAGHMTMADRPGPALQMFERFLTGAANYGELDAPNPGVPLGQPLLGSGGASGRISAGRFFLLSAFFVTLLL
ncbi:Carboxypeptidase [Aphelenchoides fujianensis]|nr:Carboxypeptidase [Aphelenchoides fujianensis]